MADGHLPPVFRGKIGGDQRAARQVGLRHSDDLDFAEVKGRESVNRTSAG